MERTDFEQWKAKEVARLLALVETERRYYQEMVAALPVPLLVLGGDTSIVSANRAFRQTFSLRSEDLRNKTIHQIFPSDHLVEAIRDAHLQGVNRPSLFIDAAGRQLRIAVVPIRNWDDETELETLLMVEDLTALDTLRGSVRAAPEPAKGSAAPDIPAVVWRADAPTLSFTSVSGAADGLFGYPLAHWRETPGFFSDRIHPEDRESTLGFYREAVERGGDATAEYRVSNASGNLSWCRETIRVGEAGAVTGVATDVTRRRELEQQLLTAGRAEALQDLSGRLAHDLNNPLMIVNGYAEEMLQGLSADDPLRADVEQILTATGRISVISGQLLNYTRRRAEPAQPVNLSHTLIEMEQRIAEAAGDSVTIDFSTVADPVWGMCDPRQFGEVILALVSGMREDARERTRISITCEGDMLTERAPHATLKPGGYARVIVRDNGRGMAPAPQVKVFEAFLARDPEASAGPGLARAYATVREWGGDLSFSSALSQGSTFTIFLPHCEAPAVEAAKDTPPALPEAPTQPVVAEPELAPGPTILIVEDEAGIRALVRKILKREGYEVLEAGTAEDALAMAAAHRSEVQLLLTDVVLPGMGGRDLAEKMVAAVPGMKVLYVSGYTDHEDVIAARFPPGARFLQKPFTLSALVGKVREALEG
ncbi:MAG TPA: response regulator [Bryobacteraceae bacterium]|nr:response regulator [Bryobacteraceae bacterium]